MQNLSLSLRYALHIVIAIPLLLMEEGGLLSTNVLTLACCYLSQRWRNRHECTRVRAATYFPTGTWGSYGPMLYIPLLSFQGCAPVLSDLLGRIVSL